MEGKYLINFSNCIPVKGYKQIIIVDLQRLEYKVISRWIYNYLTNVKKDKINNYLYKTNERQSYLIEIHNLIKEEYCFLCEPEELLEFPQISTQWESPFKFTNSIIDFADESTHLRYYKKLISIITELDIRYSLFRFKPEICADKIRKLLDYICKNSILSLELLLPYQVFQELGYNYLIKHSNIISLIVYNSPKFIVDDKSKNKFIDLIYICEQDPFNNCGNVGPHYFSIHLETFLESKNYNSCLNRKVCIDELGNIKNCPYMKEVFGNIFRDDIKSLTHNKKFTLLWKTNKDKIEVCKDCEFRYICTDCRAFIKDSKNILSQPSKCPYNPYISKWSWEEGFYPAS